MTNGKLPNLVVRAVKKVYPRFGLRDSDIILASYPKSGNTWMRFIWANMISLQELGGRTIDFHFINDELAAEYDSYSYGSIEFHSLPRLVKSHREFDRRFATNRSVYLYRNPGDTMLSYYDYKLNERSKELHDVSLSEFIRHPNFGMPAWCRHVDGWIERCDVSVSYKRMQKDALEVVVEILQKFDLEDIERGTVERAVKRSSFGNMRRIEEERGRPGLQEGRFSEQYRFTNKGRYGEWKERFSDRDLRYLEEMLKRWELFGGKLGGEGTVRR